MRNRVLALLRRHEIYLGATIIGVVFVAAMGIVAVLLRTSMVAPPYETLTNGELRRVFATAFLRFREDDGTPYLKVEVHNGTLWWIKNLEFDFEGTRHTLRDAVAFRPLHFGAVRCPLEKAPQPQTAVEYDLKILKASGYAPAKAQWDRDPQKHAGQPAQAKRPAN